MKQNQIVTIAIIGILLTSFIPILFMQNAYAVTGFQTYNKKDVSGHTDALCSGIAILPNTNYIIMACGATTDTNLALVATTYAGTLIAVSTIVVGTAEQADAECWAVSSISAVCFTGRTTNTGVGLIQVTVTSPTTISTATITNSCVVSGWHRLGNSAFTACTSAGAYTAGTFYSISLSSFTQSGQFSTLNTGICNTVTGAWALSNNKGFATCTGGTSTAVIFSYSGSGITILDGISNLMTATDSMRVFWDGGNYIYQMRASVNLGFYRVNTALTTLESRGSFGGIQPKSWAGATGGYYLLLDGIGNTLYLLSKSPTLQPPNNIVGIQTIPTTIGAFADIASANSQSFVISKGNNGNTTVFFLQALTLHNENDNPIVFVPSAGLGSIDCSLPENENILICRLGQDGAVVGSAGAFVIGNTTEGTGLLGLGCSIGIVDCTSDSNPQTNGLGILIFIASIFVVVGMFVTTQGMENTIRLPMYMWAIIIIALSAFFTITQLIDPVFLIISIIGLIALGAPKLVGMFKGGNTFGGGSTE